MNKPDKRTLDAIVKVTSHPSWPVIHEWFQGSYLNTLALCSKMQEDIQMRWVQGRCHEISDIMNTIQEARTLLETPDAQPTLAPGIS